MKRDPDKRRLVPEAPPDIEVMQQAIDAAIQSPLSKLDRADLDEQSEELAEHLRRLLREDYPEDVPAVRAVFRAAYRILDTPMRPTPADSDYTAWQHWRNLAHATDAVLDMFRRYGRGVR
ncbi:hypothetical protein ACFWY6_01040 [Streptomyces sp. NPDC059037]|uniref:hypothetical protein n=1 Tax=Streptomyces sp. NPDC059037 TaxID=3346710 RepID=UPI0036B8E053